MNLLLLSPADFITPDTVRLVDRRHLHLRNVLRIRPGQSLRVGIVGGATGNGTVIDHDADQSIVQVSLTDPPPPPLAVTLLLALPRPKALRRILQGVTAMGVKRIVLFNSSRVDKSYWQSPFLSPAAIADQLHLGLEQARDTLFPEVLLRQRFRPFIEDELPALVAGTRCLIAHPEGGAPCPVALAEPVTLAIGPEGGFIPFELELFNTRGFSPIHLGPRPLRVETIIPALLGRLQRA